ncbi:COP1-interactive protein 1-like [Juglans microcarpa x Juglans regia]|uniref:COP1-interactive protein 1-like n=1 Tax=Juglans microcarpa x Juglans regia TaxID=2249226 RepID=UPI001B7F069B|nr:COP1-interactive protein 1-like [Juglans microcarpa x Juglans regia]
MTKHRFRDSIKSFFGNHIDSENNQQLKEAKTEIEDNVEKILKLIKDTDPEGDGILENSKKEAVAQLIKNFHKHYQSLYARYDHLTGELRKEIHGKQGKESDSSSSSDSDSDYSPKDKGSQNGQLESEFQKTSDGVGKELQMAHLEVADLKRKLTAMGEEKEALNVEYHAALSKIQAADKIVADMKTEGERLDFEKTKLLTKNSELNKKLETAGKIEAELSKERENLIVEKEAVVRRIEEGEKITKGLRTMVDQLKHEKVNLEQELEDVRREVVNIKQQLESAEQQVSDLGHNLKASKEENKSLSLKISEVSNEIQQTQNTIQELTGESSQLKEKLCERETELSNLKDMSEVHENESSTRLKGFLGQITGLEQELALLQNQKRDMETQLENRAVEAKQLGEHNIELQAQISEMEMMSSKKEDEISYRKPENSEYIIQIENLKEEHEQLEGQLQECKLNLKVAEKKIEETAEEFRLIIESKDQVIADLEQLAEDLRRDLELKEDEHSSLVENVRTIEVKHRLSNQKLRVTEQLLIEREAAFRITELRFQQEQRACEERIETLSGIITSNNEAHQRMIIEISEIVNGTMTGLETVIQKFEEDFKNYENCMLEISNELHIAKNWVAETNIEKEQLKKEVHNLVEQLQDIKDKEAAMRERVGKLEVKASEEEAEKENLSKAVNQLQKTVAELKNTIKEKDDGMLGIGEEKREAIRQLCVWIDYHRSRQDYFKEMLSKVTVRGQGAS